MTKKAIKELKPPLLTVEQRNKIDDLRKLDDVIKALVKQYTQHKMVIEGTKKFVHDIRAGRIKYVMTPIGGGAMAPNTDMKFILKTYVKNTQSIENALLTIRGQIEQKEDYFNEVKLQVYNGLKAQLETAGLLEKEKPKEEEFTPNEKKEIQKSLDDAKEGRIIPFNINEMKKATKGKNLKKHPTKRKRANKKGTK